MKSIRNLLQKPHDIAHLILGMLLHYLGKLKLHIFCRKQTNCILIASAFVIYLDIFDV